MGNEELLGQKHQTAKSELENKLAAILERKRVLREAADRAQVELVRLTGELAAVAAEEQEVRGKLGQ